MLHKLLLLLPFFIINCQNEAIDSETASSTDVEDPLYVQIENLGTQIAQQPENAELYRQRAAKFYEINSYDNAINDLKKTIELDGEQVEDYHLLADIYMNYFRSREALETMETASEKFPKDIPTLLKLAEYQIIVQKHGRALRTLDQVLQQDPQNAEAYVTMGTAFKETGDTIRAINSFQEAVDRNSQLTEAWMQLGDLYAALGEPLALEYYENAIRVAPNEIAPYHAKAYYLGNVRDDLEAALKVYRTINEIDSTFEDAYFNAGLLYMDLNDFSAAHKQFDLAINYSPTHIRAYFYRGLTSEFMGDKVAARQDYEKALEKAPDYELAREQLEGLEF